ncbi:MAG: cell wall-binding repeat-containing protein [Actinomycetota bacterium]|nr:cell wall-binding repeat-containing protein [Actinomycetota bacterium]
MRWSLAAQARRTSGRVLALCLGTCLLAGSLVASATAVHQDFFVKDAPKNAVMGMIVNQPQAVRVGDVTYVAYQGIGLDPYVSSYDHVSGNWSGPYRVGDNPNTQDSHGAPAIFVDRGGYIHVFFGPHHQPLLQSISKYPLRIDKWGAGETLGSTTTYPQLVRTEEGTGTLFYRRKSPAAWIVRSQTATTTGWTKESDIFHGDYPIGEYPAFREGPDNTIHVAWMNVNWYEYYAGTWGRHNVYYMKRDSNEVWRNAAGDALPIPMTSAEATSCVIMKDPLDYTNFSLAGEDGTSVPCVMWLQGRGSGPSSYRWRFARWNGSGWTITDICTTDHFFDCGAWRLEPDGTLTAYFELGGTDGTGGGDRTYEDCGGRITKYVSADNGASWTNEGIIDPGLDGLLYHEIHLVTDGQEDDQILFTEWNNEPSIEALGMFLWGDSGPLGNDFTLRGRRLAAEDRYGTAAEIAKYGFPQGCSTVVIASGEKAADALVAAPLAKALGAPILLTKLSELPTATRTTIKGNLKATKAVIVGGKASVSKDVETALGRAGIKSIERISGEDRFETARKVASRLRAEAGPPETVYVANGYAFADALSVGPLAAWQGAPILLTYHDVVPAATASSLAEVGAGSVIVLGGTTSMKPAVAAKVGATERIDGLDRYEVSAAVAQYGITQGLWPRRVVVATGRDYPDALAASVLGARLRAATVLVRPTGVPAAVGNHLSAYADQRLDVIVTGGTASVSAQTYTDILELASP